MVAVTTATRFAFVLLWSSSFVSTLVYVSPLVAWRIALIAAGVLVGTNLLLTAGGMYLWLRVTLDSLEVRVTASGGERWRTLDAANPWDLIDRERGLCRPK
jgi:hypothetical protein